MSAVAFAPTLESTGVIKATLDPVADEAARELPFDEARRLTDLIRLHLGVARDLLRDAIRGAAWKALGYPSWEAYCATEFAEARLFRLPPVARCELVADLREDGLSNGVIAAGLGISEPTVRNDLKRASRPATADPAPVVGADGKTYRRRLRSVPAVEAAPTPAPLAITVGPIPRKVDDVIGDLLTAGARGLTAPELDALHGWGRGVAGAVLSDLHKHLRVRRLSVLEPDGTRDAFAVYTHRDHLAGRQHEGPGRRVRRSASHPS